MVRGVPATLRIMNDVVPVGSPFYVSEVARLAGCVSGSGGGRTDRRSGGQADDCHPERSEGANTTQARDVLCVLDASAPSLRSG